MERIQISLYAADPVAMAGMTSILTKKPELEVRSASVVSVMPSGAGSSDEAEDAAEREPDTSVLVLSVDTVDRHVLAAMRRWSRDGEVRIVLVVGDIHEEQVLNAIGCGVTAVVRRREASAARVLQAIKAAADGDGALPADLLARLLALVSQARKQGPLSETVAMAGLLPAGD